MSVEDVVQNHVKVHGSCLMSVEVVVQKCKGAWKWSDECGRCRAKI